MWKAFAALFICGCAIGDMDPAPAADDGDPDGYGGSGGAGARGSGGADAEPCNTPARPRPLRQVRVTGSRLIEADTLVLAAVPEPQTFWLPSARESAGAVIVVKEARGVDRRITVDTNGIDVFHGLGTVTHDTTVAWASRTFMAVEDDDGIACWMLLDPVK